MLRLYKMESGELAPEAPPMEETFFERLRSGFRRFFGLTP